MIKATEIIEKHFINTSVFFFILLWVYAAISKLSDFPRFDKQMHNQVLFPFLKDMLTNLLPPAELLLATLLTFEKTRYPGFILSAILMSLFTGYIALAVFHVFPKVPCSCGGILQHMDWTTHLYFNLFFLTLSLTTIYLIKRKEAPDAV